jgi:uncharacterized damage-inducible protein DinB
MNASDVMKYGHLTFSRAFEGLSEAECNQPVVCGVWSVKDIIAHLASYEHVLVEVLAGFTPNPVPTPNLQKMMAQYHEWNDLEVDARKSKSLQEVIQEYNDAHASAMQLVAQIPPEKLREPGTIPWYGMEYALDDYIAYAFYGHKREHSAQIYVFRDTLK